MAKTAEKILLEFDPITENILPALKEISAAFDYISGENAEKIADYFSVPLTKIYETASFYDLIKIKKQPPLVIQICSSANCALNNSLKIVREIENIFKIKAKDENNPKVKLKIISCLGRCGEGPIVVINDKVYTSVSVSSIHEILKEWI